MSELGKHIGPLVERETSIKKVLKSFVNSINIVWHGLLPHKQPKEAEKKIIKDYFPETDPDDRFFNTSMEMYKESKERIQHLEEKAFKLLTYISAVSAIHFFLLGTELKGTINVIVIVSISLLVIAMIVSLRCISVKVQKAIFIDTIIDFDDPEAIKPKSKSEITAEIVNCTVFNQTVADNTTDILKASSHILSLGIFTTVIAFAVFFSGTNRSKKEIDKVNISFSDSTFSESIKKSLILNNEGLKDVMDVLNKIETIEEQKRTQIDTLNEIIKKMHSSTNKKKQGANP
ncbi:MAG: hypothetical protein JSS79_20635 [Bacteroidetes bacterium]|nr:hypothetical protein [Bacteroidota bacterium]